MLSDLKAWLKCESGTRYPLDGPCSIGRLPGNQIVIDDSRVSRRHALLYPQTGTGYWLLDFGSSNGTRLNGRNLLKPTLLQNHDQIIIGGRHFSFWHNEVSTALPADSGAPRTQCVTEAFTATQHHTVLLDETFLMQGKNRDASDRLRYFFPEPFEWPALPRPLLRWLQQQSKLRSGSGDGTAPADPFVVKREAQRLVICFEPVYQNQSLLLLTEERSALSTEILQRLGLTARESEIVWLLAQGKSNADMAEALSLTTRTVEKHIEHILNKLNVSSRMAALLRIAELAEKMS